jgi:hypothetical protein
LSAHSAASSEHRAPARRQWIVLVCLFVLSLPAVTPRIYSSDEIQYFAFLRSLWFDRDLSFENEYRYFYDRGIARSEGFHETFLERRTDTGRRLNFGTIGCAMLWSPFYLAGDVAARIGGAPRDGFSKPYIAAVAYGSALYGFLALVLAVSCAGRLGYNGFAGALSVWLGTPLLFYMYVAPPFSHACSAFAVALFTYVWLRIRDDWSPRGAIALGAAGALMAMTREQDAFFVVGPLVDFVWSTARARFQPLHIRKTVSAAAAGCAAFCLVFLPQAAAYRVLNGHLGPHASVARKMNWSAPHALAVLFSPEHGFFVWTPLALVALLGLVWGILPPRSGDGSGVNLSAPAFTRRIAICLLIMVGLQIYVGGSVESWTVAGGFGQRRFIALTAAMVIGLSRLAAACERGASARRGRPLLAAIVILAVYWNLALTAEFASGLMDRQRLEPGKNAYDAFMTVPKMLPSLVYRYLFDRASFYKGPHAS